jgi:hypothetical protein
MKRLTEKRARQTVGPVSWALRDSKPRRTGGRRPAKTLALPEISGASSSVHVTSRVTASLVTASGAEVSVGDRARHRGRLHGGYLLNNLGFWGVEIWTCNAAIAIVPS